MSHTGEEVGRGLCLFVFEVVGREGFVFTQEGILLSMTFRGVDEC